MSVNELVTVPPSTTPCSTHLVGGHDSGHCCRTEVQHAATLRDWLVHVSCCGEAVHSCPCSRLLGIDSSRRLPSVCENNHEIHVV